MESNRVEELVNRELLQKALKSYKNDDTIEIVNFEILPGFSEHYASEMLRSKVEFKSLKVSTQREIQSIAVVIKIRPSSDSNLGFVTEGPLFETEIAMYKNVLPAFQELYQKNGLNIEFAPELIYATDQPNMIIILKDLTPDGYKCFRDPPENIEDSKLLVQRLAASIFLTENHQFDFSSFNYSMYHNEPILDLFFRDTIKAFREVVETWEGYEAYLPRLDNLIENIGNIGRKCYEPNKRGCGFNVLNHGDLHLRNILIKANDENRIERFNFVDYQVNVWCSPAIDLTYMMGLCRFTDSDESIKEDMVVLYHQELVNALNSIGYLKSPPSLLDVNVELLKHGAINIAIWITFFPFLFIDWSTMSTDDIMANDSEKSRNFKKNLYSTPILKKLIQREMKTWMYKGWW